MTMRQGKKWSAIKVILISVDFTVITLRNVSYFSASDRISLLKSKCSLTHNYLLANAGVYSFV